MTIIDTIFNAALTGIGAGIGIAIGNSIYNHFHNKAKDQKALLKELGLKLKDGIYQH